MEHRKPYVKPAITSVNLIPDEAVLGVCKVAGEVLGPNGDDCYDEGLGVCPTPAS